MFKNDSCVLNVHNIIFGVLLFERLYNHNVSNAIELSFSSMQILNCKGML